MSDLVTRAAIKAIFQTGDPLNQAAFVDLIDSVPINSELSPASYFFASGAKSATQNVTNNCWSYAGADLSLNTAGSTCLAGGQLSMSAATNVTDSTSWGIWALKSIVTGNGNTAMGVYALRDGVTINSDTAVGDSALMMCLANHCTGMGYGAGSRHTTGVGSNFYGSYSGWRGSKGDYNYIEGYYANSFSTSGDENGVTLGNHNWISGYFAAYKYQGNYSRIRGYESAYNWITGDHNFVDGFQAGSGVTSGAYNLFIGYLSGTGSQAASVSNSIGIGKGAFTTASNQIDFGGPEITQTRMRGDVVFSEAYWLKSNEATPKERIQFALDGTTYLRGHGSITHIFQDGSGVTAMRLYSTVCEVRKEQLRIVDTGGGIALYKDDSPSRAASFNWAGNDCEFRLYDGAAWRQAIAFGSTGSAATLGFYASTPVAKPTITGSRGGNAALASLLTNLAGQGLVTDSSS